jgi:hypothetical protein
MRREMIIRKLVLKKREKGVRKCLKIENSEIYK